MTIEAKKHICPLCHSASFLFSETENQIHYKCSICHSVFLDPQCRLNSEDEKSRYLNHNNDVRDSRYQQFASPITNAVQRDFSSEKLGLDFGAGTGSVIHKILTDNGYVISQYDPFFHPHHDLLDIQYDFITCCEVMEHFFHPDIEFRRLKKMLKQGGKLYCMTELYNENQDFAAWYYKNDPTHVFLYHTHAIQWIQQNLGYSDVQIEGRLITFSTI